MTEDIKQLVLDASNGSQLAYTKLHKEYYRMVWNTIFFVVKNETDTDDLVSISFTKAFMNIEKFSRFISFEMWLKTIALNTALDFVRKRSRQDPVYELDNDDNYLELTSSIRTPESEVINDELALKLNKTFYKLRKRFRDLLYYRHIEDMTYAEMAQRMGISEGAIKSELHKARKYFKHFYNNDTSNTIRDISRSKRMHANRVIAS